MEVFISLGGGAGVGPLPSPVPIATAAVGARYGVHRVALEGRYWARAQASTVVDPAAGGTLGIAAGALTYGALFAVGEGARLGPVGGVEVGAIYGTGAGDIVTRSATGAWAAADLGGAVDLAISPRWTFHAGLTGFVPFTRPTFIVDAASTVYRPAPIGARVEGALEVTF